ncbi:hypothetical protein BCR34DRAFT_598884 [Clohesyomyces aquaticus]|uniref:Uncharacterized protein n=1 Tax=Clohesyomyces aquaticus TaxID=1231657 RepID=A0A1Y1ZWY0_9PLEO|nr:hypothetical protein BCR34DRAFT_598884 [Clohesyomyces aquaticus]
MAESSNGSGQSLEEILRTLASLAPAQNSAPQLHPGHVAYPLGIQHNPASQQLPFSNQAPGTSGSSVTPDLGLNSYHIPQQRQHPPKPQTPATDPATITEWKFAIRCVSKMDQQNPNFAVSIRKLMKAQEKSVQDWETRRERFIEEQAKKREHDQANRAALYVPKFGIRALVSVLILAARFRSLPGLQDLMPLRTPEEDEKELKQYDMKVYRACQAMVTQQTTDLKQLGVPFFGVRPNLILPDDAAPSTADDDVNQKPGSGMNRKITKKELLASQRKMLKYLKDMFEE